MTRTTLLGLIAALTLLVSPAVAFELVGDRMVIEGSQVSDTWQPKKATQGDGINTIAVEIYGLDYTLAQGNELIREFIMLANPDKFPVHKIENNTWTDRDAWLTPGETYLVPVRMTSDAIPVATVSAQNEPLRVDWEEFVWDATSANQNALAELATAFGEQSRQVDGLSGRIDSVDNQLGSLDASLDAWRTDVDTAAEERERIQQQIETEAVAREAADTLLQTEVAAGKQIGQNAHETAISASNGVLAAIKRSNELTDALHDTSLLVNTNANDIASVRDDMETADATLREDMETADAALRGDLDSLTEQGGLHWLTILTAIAVLGVAGGLGWLIWKRRKDRKEKEEEKNLLKDLEGDVKQLKAEIENHHVLAEKHQDVVASAITLNTEGGVLVSTDDLGNTSATVDSPIEVVASVGSQEFEVVNFWRNSDTPPGSVECDLLRDDKGRVVGRISASKAKGSLARAISAGRLPEKTVSP